MGKHIRDTDLEKYEDDDQPIRERVRTTSKPRKFKDPEKIKKKIRKN
jgi:hypothetical protein